MTTEKNISNSQASLGQVFVIAVQLCLVILVVRVFHIENWAFLKLCMIATAGFVVHSFLPFGLRVPFFALLSVAGIASILGVVSTIWLIGIGLVLIGLCHLPVHYYVRVGLLAAAGLALACVRVDWIVAPWSSAIWPILGSMFMFRLIVYLYDVSNEKKPVTIWWSLGYFFMLPNVCFPLFPIVDFKRFRSNYYNEPAIDVYQRGVHWMARGALHLILYRAVYYYMTLSPVEVNGSLDLIRYSMAAFFLYLRVSGTFHMIIGMLLLFGFNLPESHHHYYLSASFSDLWRRINIYYKDFMMKIVFYPTYFRLRSWGPTWAMTLSISLVFVLNWVLHSYQWFWLRGTAFVEINDMIFWVILAVLVLINSVWEDRRGRERSLGQSGRSVWSYGAQVCSTAGVFVTMCTLWSMWTTPSLSEWFTLWEGTGLLWLGLTLFLVAAFLGTVWCNRMNAATSSESKKYTLKTWRPSLRQQAAMTSLTMIAVFIIGIPRVYSAFGQQTVEVMRNLRASGRLSRRDLVAMERGYYEKLSTVNQFNTELWNRYVQRTDDWNNMVETEGMRETGDFEWNELVPNTKLTLKRQPLEINRWGMRDKDYEKEKPSGTLRMVLLGASHTFGSGVADDETFENVVEARLNKLEHQAYENYEILNLAVPGYDLVRSAHYLGTYAIEFQPDIVLSVSQVQDGRRAVQHLARIVAREYPIPYPELEEIVRRADVSSEMGQSHIERRLLRYQDELLAWAYGRIAEICREHDIPGIWILLQPVSGAASQEEVDRLFELARNAGLITWDFMHVYDGHREVDLRLSAWDVHPNAKAHGLVAEHFFSMLAEQGIIETGSKKAIEAHEGEGAGN